MTFGNNDVLLNFGEKNNYLFEDNNFGSSDEGSIMDSDSEGSDSG